MSEQNKAIAQKVYDIINSGNLGDADAVIASDVVEHEQMPGFTGSGSEVFRHFVTTFRSAFPDLRIRAEDMVAEGDKVGVRFTMSGTHRGDFNGIPPTGKQFQINGIEMVRIANGKVAEHWGNTDSLSFMQQLGLMPAQ
jgi:steroid delta-isomerase-like uncharacterized protein